MLLADFGRGSRGGSECNRCTQGLTILPISHKWPQVDTCWLVPIKAGVLRDVAGSADEYASSFCRIRSCLVRT